MKRVFMVSRHPLLTSGIECLLREAGLEMVGQETNVFAARGAIKVLEPDVVILEADEPGGPWACAVLELAGLGMKVIVLELDGNEMSVYWGERQEVAKVKDLVAAIVNDASEGPWPEGGVCEA